MTGCRRAEGLILDINLDNEADMTGKRPEWVKAHPLLLRKNAACGKIAQ